MTTTGPTYDSQNRLKSQFPEKKVG